jgi:hypothetical protein
MEYVGLNCEFAELLEEAYADGTQTRARRYRGRDCRVYLKLDLVRCGCSVHRSYRQDTVKCNLLAFGGDVSGLCTRASLSV